MLQLQLSSAFDKGRKHDQKVVCVQRTDIGLFVGTMRETEDGYMGHLLSPKHPLLPAVGGDGRLGFLAINRADAYEALALQVAKAAWNGTLGFEPTCLDNCSRATSNAFVDWLVAQICDSRASSLFSKPSEASERRSTAVRIKPEVAKERTELIAQAYKRSHSAPGRLQ